MKSGKSEDNELILPCLNTPNRFISILYNGCHSCKFNRYAFACWCQCRISHKSHSVACRLILSSNFAPPSCPILHRLSCAYSHAHSSCSYSYSFRLAFAFLLCIMQWFVRRLIQFWYELIMCTECIFLTAKTSLSFFRFNLFFYAVSLLSVTLIGFCVLILFFPSSTQCFGLFRCVLAFCQCLHVIVRMPYSVCTFCCVVGAAAFVHLMRLFYAMIVVCCLLFKICPSNLIRKPFWRWIFLLFAFHLSRSFCARYIVNHVHTHPNILSVII